MKYLCPYCETDIAENDIFQGACPNCKKVIDFSTVKKIAPPEEPVKEKKPTETPGSTCHFCRKQIPGEAEFCPHCGKSITGETQTEKPANPFTVSPKNIIGGLVGFIILGIIVSTCMNLMTTTPSSTPRPSAPVSQTPQKPQLEVLDWDFVEKNIGSSDYPIYSPYIVGTLRNNTSKTYSYVQITFNLYDQNDAQVGSTLTNINNLEPGGTWKFEAPILETNAKKAKITDITGF